MRSKRSGKSFSEEVCDAIDLYLKMPAEKEAVLETFAKEANRAAGRMIGRLDKTMLHMERGLKRISKSE